MLEPSASSPPTPPPTPRPSSEGRALRLLHDVRVAQRRALWSEGVLYGSAVLLSVGLGALLWGKLAALVFALLAAFCVVLVFGVVLVSRRVGDDARTARRLAELSPSLNLDLLAAVELSKALGTPNDFSPELARAFLREVDARAARHQARTLLSPKPVHRAAGVALACAVLVVGVGSWQSKRVAVGWAAVLARAPATAHLKRQPITGDFELTYHYPSYTGLEPRTVSGTNGELTGPAGTEVEVKTRADREVDSASVLVGEQSLPLQVKGRDLSGTLVLSMTGSYHVVFLEGARVVAEGPELPIQVQADSAPQVRLTAPTDVLELTPEQPSVTLKYDASDDFGLTTLELVYTLAGSPEQRVSLKPDDGRATRGSYVWQVGALGIKPGGSVRYFLEAKDNDTVTGPKKGTSRTQTITLYSAAEHRREALRKTELLWERLVTHLADRMESPERVTMSPETALKATPLDERGALLSGDFRILSADLLKERDPFEDVISALLNVGAEMQRDQSAVAVHRKMYLRLMGKDPEDLTRQTPARDPVYLRAVTQRLTDQLTRDREHSEKNVLYLEALLDRVKLDAIKELANDLKDDRRELSKLLEEFGRTKEPQVKQQVLQQMAALKRHMMELQERMAELAKGIRDDFMNREALEEMMQSENLGSKLDEIEKLVNEGNAEEALKKMQELSMQMDETLQQLEEAADEADEQADPELTRKYREFSDSLEQTAKQQEGLADKTKALRDKYRNQVKDRIAKQGAALKQELQQKLAELKQSYLKLEGHFRLEDSRSQGLRDIENVKQSLDANDFDLASEAADKLEEHAKRLSESAAEQQRLDELFQNPPDVRRESKDVSERASGNAKKAEEVGSSLRGLFPQNGSQLTEAELAQMGEMAKQQRQLEQKTDQLQQQMEALNERAPIFDDDAKQLIKKAGQRMGGAGQKLTGRDPSHGYSEQQGALQALKGLQQQMQQQQQGGKGGKGGMPMPTRSPGRRGKNGQGRENDSEKVEIPDEDPNRAPREFRKDVMDAMKQGAPDRYRDQNKRYYEELVK